MRQSNRTNRLTGKIMCNEDLHNIGIGSPAGVISGLPAPRLNLLGLERMFFPRRKKCVADS